MAWDRTIWDSVPAWSLYHESLGKLPDLSEPYYNGFVPMWASWSLPCSRGGDIGEGGANAELVAFLWGRCWVFEALQLVPSPLFSGWDRPGEEPSVSVRARAGTGEL